jgi:hypothetical protein
LLDGSTHPLPKSSTQFPFPAKRVAIHGLDTLGRQFITKRVGSRKILFRPRFLALNQNGLDLSVIEAALGRIRRSPRSMASRFRPSTLSIADRAQLFGGRHLLHRGDFQQRRASGVLRSSLMAASKRSITGAIFCL